MFKLTKIQGKQVRETLNEMRDTERARRLLGLTEESFNRKLDGEEDISLNEADILYDFLGGDSNSNLGFLRSSVYVPFSTGVGTYERRPQEDKLIEIDPDLLRVLKSISSLGEEDKKRIIKNLEYLCARAVAPKETPLVPDQLSEKPLYTDESKTDENGNIDIEPFSRKTLEVKLGFNPEKASLERSLLYAFLETRIKLDAKKIRALVKKSKFYSALELDKSSKFFRYEEKNIKGLVKYLIKSN